MPQDKIVVLGLVTTKTSRREKKEELITRIRQASQFVPLERLAISPQCGFSSSILGNRISLEDQIYKLRVIADTTREVWSLG